MMEQQPGAFMSYTRVDDQNDGGWLTRFRESLSGTVAFYTGEPFPIFQDIEGVVPGQQGAERSAGGLQSAMFLIPIITPSFFESAHCREELCLFLQREEELGRSDLILPVYYIECPVLEDPDRRAGDELAQILFARRCSDWRDLRLLSFRAKQVRAALDELAMQVRDALKRPPPGPLSELTAPLLERAINAPPSDIDTELSEESPLEAPEGPLHPDSPLYIERRGDRLARDIAIRQGVTFTIKGARQVGKSSLLNRAVAAARAANKHVAWIDFQRFDAAARTNADTFFRQFCARVAGELGLDSRFDVHWDAELENVARCTRSMQHAILGELDSPVVLALDQADSLLDSPFRTDFFGMIRSWHDSRATGPIWRQLDLVLVTSTEPDQLVTDANRSPFSVGEVIELVDFTLEQVAELNQRHGAPLSRGEVRHLMMLLNGQPYLVRRALYLVSSRRMTAGELLEQATLDDGPFEEHLQHHLQCLRGHAGLAEELRHIIRQRAASDMRLCEQLLSVGLVRREGQAVVPRCRLYVDYLEKRI